MQSTLSQVHYLKGVNNWAQEAERTLALFAEMAAAGEGAV